MGRSKQNGVVELWKLSLKMKGGGGGQTHFSR